MIAQLKQHTLTCPECGTEHQQHRSADQSVLSNVICHPCAENTAEAHDSFLSQDSDLISPIGMIDDITAACL